MDVGGSPHDTFLRGKNSCLCSLADAEVYERVLTEEVANISKKT